MTETLARQLNRIIHQGSPYKNFNAKDYKLDLRGWGFESPVFEILINEIRPKIIIEVGTWNGSSAIKMANLAKQLQLETTIICIDTWLGSPEHRIDPDYRPSLKLQHGYPKIYYQFLANVVLSDMTDCIVPIPQVSLAACRWLTQMGFGGTAGKVDLIYIDADHTASSVFSDISEFWGLLSPTGVMFGDDYHDSWPGVQTAVKLFSKNMGKDLQTLEEKWIIRKKEN